MLNNPEVQPNATLPPDIMEGLTFIIENDNTPGAPTPDGIDYELWRMIRAARDE